MSKQFRNCSGHLALVLMLGFAQAHHAGAQEAKDSPAEEARTAQDILDEAIAVKLAARSMADLEKAIGLCEKALSMDLDETTATFAKSLAASALFEHAYRITEALLSGAPLTARSHALRRLALQDLEKAIDYERENADSHLLIARLHALPGGDRQRGMRAVESALGALPADNDVQRSAALQIRAGYAREATQRDADLDEALRLDPQNIDALRSRGVWRLTTGRTDEAVKDLRRLLEIAPDDVRGFQAIATALTAQSTSPLGADPTSEDAADAKRKLDEAMEFVNRVIDLDPRGMIGYRLRARIHEFRKDRAAAIDDLGTALRRRPNDIEALMARARLMQETGKSDLSKADIDLVLKLRPGLPQALLQRSFLSASQGQYLDAAADLAELLKADAKNVQIRGQLAKFYYLAKRPSRTAELCTEMLNEDDSLVEVYRLRADAYLSSGKHAEAIQDYATALERLTALVDQNSEANSLVENPASIRPGILNNLAWVLATSTIDQVRDGSQAVKYAEEACKLTEYKKAYILSTLAASYAEMGDFDSAIEWSSKAVEGAKSEIKQANDQPDAVQKSVPELEEQLKQLEAELESYQRKEPWRELIEEKEPVDEPDKASDSEDLLVDGKPDGPSTEQDGEETAHRDGADDPDDRDPF